MLAERFNAIREELLEVGTIRELKAIHCNWEAEAAEVANNAECNLMLRSTLSRLRLFGQKEEPVEVSDKVRELEAQIAALTKSAPVKRAERNYRLLSTDVRWSTKPQLLAIARILECTFKVGEVVPESVIVQAMEANEDLFATRQGGKRIWDYYKGSHNEGLAAHGNVERI